MGSSEEIYWNMAKNNRKLDAKMPSCPHFCYNLFIMNCLLVVVASVLVSIARVSEGNALTNTDA